LDGAQHDEQTGSAAADEHEIVHQDVLRPKGWLWHSIFAIREHGIPRYVAPAARQRTRAVVKPAGLAQLTRMPDRKSLFNSDLRGGCDGSRTATGY
jgi:hypothetical protein